MVNILNLNPHNWSINKKNFSKILDLALEYCIVMHYTFKNGFKS